MKLQQFFKKAVDLGIQHDPRGKKAIDKLLNKEKERMKKLEGQDKIFYDAERMWNPFPDCRIINGSGEEEFNRIMVGIDIETPEMLLIDRLREKGEKIDGALIHHPEGRALADLEKIMPLQVDLLAGVGVPVNHAEGLLQDRMSKIWRSIHADNLFRTERAAELLDIPAVCCHTITDNMVWKFMTKHICEKEYDNLGEIVNAIMEIPEYVQYGKKGNPAIIVSGSKSSRPGKIYATEFTGGTNGPEQFFEAKARAGVGTVLSMHVTEKALEEAKKHHIHVIQCSHMASDSLGVNLMLDEIKKSNPKLHVIPASGFVRIERKKW